MTKKLLSALLLSAALFTNNTTQAQWAPVGSADFSPGDAGNSKVLIANNGTPYVEFSNTSTGYAINVEKYNGSAWVPMGSNPGSTFNFMAAFTLDSMGTPYVAFPDSADNFGNLNVKKFDGTNWVNLGVTGINSNSVQSIVVGGDGTVYLAFNDATQSQNMSVMKYSNSAWTYVGAQGIVGAIDYPTLAIGHNQHLYLMNRGNSGTTVFEFDGTSWNNITPTDANTDIYSSLAIDNNSVPYLAYTSANSTPAYVSKYTGGSWTTIGGGAFNTTGSPNLALALTTAGNPVVFYTDFDITIQNATHGTVQQWNGSAWVYDGSRGFTANSVTDPAIATGPAGDVYVAYTEQAGELTNALSVEKFGGANGIHEPTNVTNLNVYPNPGNGNFEVNIETKQVDDVQLSVYNALGQLVTQQAPLHTTGILSAKLQLNDAAAGIYLLQIITNEGVESRTLVVE